MALVRDRASLRGAAMAITAAYLPPRPARNPAISPRSLPPRARRRGLGGAGRSLGRDGLAELMERTCRMARRFADQLSAAGFEVLNDVVLNQVVVSLRRRRNDRRGHRRAPGRRDLLVRRRPGKAAGDADQRQLLEHHRRRYRRERRRGPRLRRAVAPVGGLDASGRLSRTGRNGVARPGGRAAAEPGRQVGRARRRRQRRRRGWRWRIAAATGSRTRCTSRGRPAGR